MNKGDRLDKFLDGLAQVLGASIGNVINGLAYGVGVCIAIKIMFHL